MATIITLIACVSLGSAFLGALLEYVGHSIHQGHHQ